MKQGLAGFTLVELLVVISIISIMAALAIGTLTNLQVNSRDTKRKADLAVIQSALEHYHADWQNYPLSSEVGIGTTAALTSPDKTRVYLKNLPLDPSGLARLYQPLPETCTNAGVSSACTKYCLYATLENPANSQDLTECTVSGYNYEISSP